MLQNRRNLFLEGFLNNVWICAAGGRNPVLAGAGDRKQGERGDFHRAVFLGISVLVGMGLFLLYDIFRIFRRIVPHGAIWIGVEDFCYWLLCTAAVFLMLYQENDGMIRGFAIGGVIFGMILYFFLLSRFVVKINVCILKKILGIAGRITGFVTKPFRKIGRKIISFLCKQLKKWIKMIKMSLCKL